VVELHACVPEHKSNQVEEEVSAWMTGRAGTLGRWGKQSDGEGTVALAAQIDWSGILGRGGLTGNG
jgi:hypothetical protein